jgi:DNA-binding response OmpR family regulator
MRVLIVDDNQNITDTFSFFESNNIETKVLNDSNKAATEIKSNMTSLY